MYRFLILLFPLTLILSLSYSQSVLINEFSSLNSHIFDEDNDSPDWFELINASAEPINLLDYSISDDSNDYNKWKFPAVKINPNEVVLVFASGKDRTDFIYYENVISHGDEFSYAIGKAEISDAWRNDDFDDSTWLKGPSGFGYGDDDDATTVSDGTLSIFVRKKFQVNGLADVKELILHVDYDDGFVAYINGFEVARSNMGTAGSSVAYNQVADTYIEPLIINGLTPELHSINNFKNILNEGENVLAIQVHNNSTGSSDLTLIPFLSLGYDAPQGGSPMPEVLKMHNKTIHTNFKISADGERLFLSNASGDLIDETDSVTLPYGISYGRLPKELNTWVYYNEPTPGDTNSSVGYTSLGNDSIFFSPRGGKYSGFAEVSLSSSQGFEIYYTTDGSNPTLNSNKYTMPIILDQSTVIKALVFDTEVLSITPSVETYILENRDFTLPIVSLSTDPYNLWDWNYGIYVKGPNAEADIPFLNANFWMDWERPIHIEYFDKSGNKRFAAAAGTKIFGAWSRAAEQKSMSIFARSSYGNKSFKYPIFNERETKKYKSFILRNSGNDWNFTAFRDAMMTGLMHEVDIDRQAYQPAIVYLNGAYWGLLNMREKVNEEYLADNHSGVDANKVDILEGNAEVVEGSAEHYNQMLSFINSHTLRIDANYDSICKMMDVYNFMDYEIAQIYFDNTDWPGNNLKFWRPQTTTGKWRWILYDTDFGFGIYSNQSYYNNTLNFALETNGPGWPNPPWSTYLLRSLMKNKNFESEFINRFADRLNYNFLPTTVNHLIDSLKGNIEKEIPFHNERWNHMWNFSENVQNMKTFADKRPENVRNHINNRFGLGGEANVTLIISDKSHGSIQVNTLLLKEYPWTGKYFKNNPITVNALAKPGYEFSHWEGSGSLNPELVISPVAGLTLKAIFVESVKDYNSVVVNEINYKSADNSNTGDWIELYNSTGAAIDLGTWVLKDSNDNSGYTFPKGTLISKRNYLVVCKDVERFRAIYPMVQNVIGNLEFGLSSTADMLRLYDGENLLIDSVFYLNENPWPEINSNQTIALVRPNCDNSLANKWEESVGNGTPGTHNDYFTEIIEHVKSKGIMASCFPNPTRGNATVRWLCSENQNVKISVFNIQGECIRTIFDGSCYGGTYEEMVLEPAYQNGIYFVQVNFENGDSKTLKLIKM